MRPLCGFKPTLTDRRSQRHLCPECDKTHHLAVAAVGLNLARSRRCDAQVSIHAAKTQLSRLADAAAAGEEINIAKSGKRMARLGPFSARNESAVRAFWPVS